jgi:hypothetical protein
MKTAREVFDEVKLMPLAEQLVLYKLMNDWVLNYTLNTLGISEAVEDEDSFERGVYEESDKPSTYAGIWQGEKRDLQTIRAKAWKRER